MPLGNNGNCLLIWHTCIMITMAYIHKNWWCQTCKEIMLEAFIGNYFFDEWQYHNENTDFFSVSFISNNKSWLKTNELKTSAPKKKVLNYFQSNILKIKRKVTNSDGYTLKFHY